MKIDQAAPEAVTELWTTAEPKLGQAASLEEAAQELARSVYGQFGESVVLTRAYITIPFESLPDANRTFVSNLAGSAGAGSQLEASTPVLSLIASFGQETAWQDRRNSKGHVGIPLISASFVHAIPMIARLLEDLGLPVDWADEHDIELIKKLGSGFFFVENAAEAVDSEGRNIIAAQDFVSDYQVRSVFGAAAPYSNGQMVVAITFCRDIVRRQDAESFLSLVDHFKNRTQQFVQGGRIFTS